MQWETSYKLENKILFDEFEFECFASYWPCPSNIDLSHQLKAVSHLPGEGVALTPVVGVGVGGEHGHALGTRLGLLKLDSVGPNNANGSPDLIIGEGQIQVFLDKVPDQKFVELPRLVVLVPLVIVIHEGVNDSPGTWIVVAEEKKAKRDDTGVKVEGVLIIRNAGLSLRL